MPKYYHGTVAEELTEIHPGGTHSGQTVHPLKGMDGYVYFTTNVTTAWHYAELAWNATSSGIPRVYEVVPTGEVIEDPNQEFAGDYCSRLPLKVVRELPMPELMGNPEDWM